MLVVNALTMRFGSLIAVDRLSFTMAPGEAVALWGPNGAGKTTVLRCLLGLLPYAGEVYVAGYDVRKQGKAARRQVGFVPQELHFHDDLTVQETLEFYARLKQTTLHPDLVERLGLASYLQQRVRGLSGGMKQRLGLAVALLADPPLLLLDEPTANLDAVSRQDFLDLVAACKAAGKTLVFSSHRQEEVTALADRVLVLERGRLVVACSPAELGSYCGWQTALRLYVPAEQIESTLVTLTTHGFRAHRNGTSVYVSVAAGAKSKPIQVLVQAGIAIRDFDVEQYHEEKE